MEITPELIKRFLANGCDPDEFEMVLHYLETHPAEAGYWLGSAEWAAIDGQAPVADHDQQEVYAELRARLFPVSKEVRGPGLVRRIAWPAVAASLLLAGAGIWMSRSRVHAPEEVSLAARTPAKVGMDTAAVADRWIVKTNEGVKPLQLILPDESEVTLYAHSRLRYASRFGVTHRESRLEGVADFSVHKNKALPFTVHAGVLSTTALGTSFGVKAPAGSKAVAIRLYTGKVVVKADPVAGWSRDVLLAPGEQVCYDAKGGPALVSHFEGAPAHAQHTGDEQELVFNNTSLKQVFRQLAIQYHVTIKFRAADLKGMNFTGTVSRTDSLQSFLQLLGNMNNLEIREEAGGFRVVP
jgi:ferric-dicitrate binding protein FerR (iron transport regulator)